MGISLTPQEQFEVFGADYSEHVAEAEQRWGDTEAFRSRNGGLPVRQAGLATDQGRAGRDRAGLRAGAG